MTTTIAFTDGSAYERFMGRWSRMAGERFLDWLALPPGLRWLDIGCGNGAFTDLLAERCAPAALAGIDPSEAQLAFARKRPALARAEFRAGDAMALPYPARAFDAAVMPLVIFFLTDPARGVAEMARVVRPGGSVSAYAWDMEGGGFPYEPLHREVRAMGFTLPATPNPAASRLDALQGLWTGAGLAEVATRVITVERTFADADDYWATVAGGPSVGPTLATMPPEDLAMLKVRMRPLLPTGADGRIRCEGRAHAVRGLVPMAAR